MVYNVLCHLYATNESNDYSMYYLNDYVLSISCLQSQMSITSVGVQ